MSWAERTRQGIEEWFTKKREGSPTRSWAERIGSWFGDVLMGGVIKVADYFEPDLREEAKASMTRLSQVPNLPPDIKNILDKATSEPKAIQIAAILPYVIGVLIGMGLGMAEPMRRIGSYMLDKFVRSARLDPRTAIEAYYRKLINKEKLESVLSDTGWSNDDIEVWLSVLMPRLDPFIAVRAYWRGFIDEDYLKQTLRAHFYSEADVEAFIEVAHFYPSSQDLITWQAKEVFEPDMIAKYGLEDEFDRLDLSMFAKAGVTEEQARNYWIAHWEHASFMQVVEMLHRGIITEDDMWEWFRVVEIPPFWRQKLIDMSWNVPTRVDVRRWWDMRTITEERLRKIYTAQGYHDEDLDDYVLWTKVYVAFPDLIARWQKGWITEEDVRSELTGLGMPSERVDEMIETKKKNIESAVVEKESELTKSEIYAGVKKGVITWNEGLELLQDTGLSEEDAQYILEVRVGTKEATPEIVKGKDLTKADILNAIKKGVLSISDGRTMLIDLGYSAGEADILIMVKLNVSSLSEYEATLVGASPTSYTDFKVLTQRLRQLQGKEAKVPSLEVRQAEKALRDAEEALRKEKEKGTHQVNLIPYEKAVSDTSFRYRQLLEKEKKEVTK